MGKVKTVDFSENIAACDLKVGRCRHLQGVQKTITLLIGIYFYITTSSGMYLT